MQIELGRPKRTERYTMFKFMLFKFMTIYEWESFVKESELLQELALGRLHNLQKELDCLKDQVVSSQAESANLIDINLVQDNLHKSNLDAKDEEIKTLKDELQEKTEHLQLLESRLLEITPLFKSVQDFGFPPSSGLYNVIGQQIQEGTPIYFNGQVKWDAEKHFWQPQNFYITGILNVISWKEVKD